MKGIAIFDMDGTLIDSSKGITNSINHVRDHLSLEPLSIDKVVELINGPQKNLAFEFYNTPTYEDTHKERFEAHYFEECTKETYLYDGIKEVLEALQQSEIKCSISTNASSQFAKKMLDALGVIDHFDYIFGSDTHKSKPEPDMLLDILKNYSYDKYKDLSAIMVGDNIKDLEAAKNAEIDGVHVAWGFCTYPNQNSLQHPSELLKHIIPT